MGALLGIAGMQYQNGGARYGGYISVYFILRSKWRLCFSWSIYKLLHSGWTGWRALPIYVRHSSYLRTRKLISSNSFLDPLIMLTREIKSWWRNSAQSSKTSFLRHGTLSKTAGPCSRYPPKATTRANIYLHSRSTCRASTLVVYLRTRLRESWKTSLWAPQLKLSSSAKARAR